MRPSRPCLLLAVVTFCLVSAASQQPNNSAPIEIDETHLTTLRGTVHTLATPQNDRGQVEPDFRANRLLLTLARPAAREQALQQFLQAAHTPASKSFHQWLTPSQFGSQFGALDEDRQVVTTWLQSHGLSVDHIASNGSTVEFSGTAAQVSEALHTQIHRYFVNGKTFYANSQELSVPDAVRPRIASFAPLNNFPLTSYAAPAGPATYSRSTHRATRIATPEFTTTANNAPFYALAPEDFATQYDVDPVYTAGINGTGQTIGIVGTSNINLALVDAYRKLFNLPASHTQVVIDGTDPGDPSSPNVEAFLDTEVSGAVAPAATVNLYIAGGQPLTNSLGLAALRAVEDNQASVISVSYGNCEQLIGNAGNQFWNSLWEQAAAQGQSVFVSSGDSGPTTCTLQSSTTFPITLTSTLSVNGISSTPWNISVGGTDFYYSDYATGGSSIATLWNQTNDGSLGSLKAPLPEQPWDNVLGFNAIPFNPAKGFTIPSAAGGGGVSNCSQATTSSSGETATCISGYAKPSWQNSPGVPNDQARDLPDVSLFAANGLNLSAWPICADPGDCSASPPADSHVFLVGGTSASSPAMAGIMALINQKYGRQGQANFTLYSLARTTPSIFHDVNLGTNDALCEINTGSVCNSPVPSLPNTGIESYGLYAAGPGYDLASGLGSVDVGKLFTAWNTTAATPSATTLQVSPATLVHGSPAAVTVTVTASAGSATPTGNVALTTSNTAVALRDNPALTLSNGTASSSLSSLPGGTYNLAAQYGGDSTFAPSTSSPVALNITPEPSKTALQANILVTLAPGSPPPTFSLSTVPYGAAISFSATPSGTNTATTGLATGTVAFTDGSTSTTLPLNINGVATWNPQVLALGAHSITAAYSGDASYSASTASPFALTVVKGTALFQALPETTGLALPNLGQSAYAAGSDLVVHVLLRGNGFSVPPSGSVTVALGTTTQTLTLNANEYLNENLSNAFVTFPSVPAGSYTLSATYTGDANWNSVTYSVQNPLVFAASTASATTTVLSLSPGAVDSSDSVTVKITVTDAMSHPLFPVGVGGLVSLFANGTQVTSVFTNPAAGASTTVTIPATVFPLGTLQVVAVYLGNGLYDLPSTSAPVSLTVSATDFTLSSAASNLAIKSGQAATVPVLLSGPYGVGVPVTLTCATSSTAIGCSISPSSSTVTGTATATLTINAFTTSAISGANIPPTTANRHFDLRKPGTAFAILFFVLLPFRRRCAVTRGSVSLFLLLIAASFAVGCSGGSSRSTPPSPTPPIRTNAPTGTYTATVTGVSGGVAHTTAIIFQVQ